MTLTLSFGTLAIIHKGEDIKRCLLRMPAHFPSTSWLAGKVLQHHCNQPPTLLLASHPPLLPEKQTPHCSRAAECSKCNDNRKTSLHPSISPITPRHAAACGMCTSALTPAKASVFLFPFSFCLSYCVPMIRCQWTTPPPPPCPSFLFSLLDTYEIAELSILLRRH